MNKKRLIFTLLFDNGGYMLSRNFRLQRVGDIKWLLNSYNFKEIAFSIDELIILNVSRNEKDYLNFCEDIQTIARTCFVPISAGGGIRDLESANKLMHSGADKLVLNSPLIKDTELVKKLIRTYGTQCIVASVDFKIEANKKNVYIENGTELIDMDLDSYLLYLQDLGVGEIYLNSMDQDGTGQNFCIDPLKHIVDELNIPVILAGGAGHYDHFINAVKELGVSAVATANLFNFIGEGFPDARAKMLESEIDLAIWDRQLVKSFKGHFPSA